MAIKAFATVSDLEKRWRVLADDEKSRAESLIEDASVMIASAMRSSGIQYDDADELLIASLNSVTCAVVRRAMATPVDIPALTQYSQSAIGISESMSYANPSGDLYLTKQEKKLLGISGGVVGLIRPAIHDGAGELLDGW